MSLIEMHKMDVAVEVMKRLTLVSLSIDLFLF